MNDGNSTSHRKEFFLCDIEKLVPNTYQPRKIFQKEALEELIESVKVHGIIQPILVRHKDGNYEIIAGERRWRAAQRAGLKQVPVVVKDVQENGVSLEMAIVENVQREELNCIEEAIAYQQLMDEFQLSQEDIAAKVGKNRATIANTMRLLKLPVEIREDLAATRITMGHARALLALETTEDQVEIKNLIVKRQLSVRETERKVNEKLKPKKQTVPDRVKNTDIHLAALEDDLRRRFGCQVRIVGNGESGSIQFSYSTANDLMRLSDMLKGQNVTEETQSV
jgi:ParB family chromosome partitioning protein